MTSNTIDGTMNICEVCKYLDGDESLKLCRYCRFCDAWICIPDIPDYARRGKAALKKVIELES